MSLSDWYLTPWLPLEKNSSKSTPLCGPPVVGPIGLSPDHSQEIIPWTHHWNKIFIYGYYPY